MLIVSLIYINTNAQMHTRMLRKLNSRFALEHRYDIVTLKWVIKNWNLKREDFLLSSKGVMDHKTLDCAKYLQSKYNFNAYEALGNDLRVLGSWCGDARNLTFIQWYVRSSILIQCTQKQN